MRRNVRSAAGMKQSGNEYPTTAGVKASGDAKGPLREQACPGFDLCPSDPGGCMESMEASTNCFFFLNAKGTLVHCNKAFSSMLLYDRDDVPGIRLQEFVLGWDEKRRRDAFQRIDSVGYAKFTVDLLPRTGPVIPVVIELGLYFKADVKMYYGVVCRADGERIETAG